MKMKLFRGSTKGLFITVLTGGTKVMLAPLIAVGTLPLAAKKNRPEVAASLPPAVIAKTLFRNIFLNMPLNR